MIKKYSTLRESEWYSNPNLNGLSVPEEGSEDKDAPKKIASINPRMFSQGYCAEFAIALHELTGYPIFSFDEILYDDFMEEKYPQFLHYAVKHPSGKYLDVKGLRTEKEIINNLISYNNTPVDPEKITVQAKSLEDVESEVSLEDEALELAREYISKNKKKFKAIKKASSEKQSDEFFQTEFDNAIESAVSEVVKEFLKKKVVGEKDPKTAGQYKWILSKAPENQKEVRVSFFDKGIPVSHSNAPLSKSGLSSLIREWNLHLPYLRKDIPDWAGLGNVKPIKTYYKLRLRDISPGTVPPGFVGTEGSRVVVYDRLLSENEIKQYELEPLKWEE